MKKLVWEYSLDRVKNIIQDFQKIEILISTVCSLYIVLILLKNSPNLSFQNLYFTDWSEQDWSCWGWRWRWRGENSKKILKLKIKIFYQHRNTQLINIYIVHHLDFCIKHRIISEWFFLWTKRTRSHLHHEASAHHSHQEDHDEADQQNLVLMINIQRL